MRAGKDAARGRPQAAGVEPVSVVADLAVAAAHVGIDVADGHHVAVPPVDHDDRRAVHHDDGRTVDNHHLGGGRGDGGGAHGQGGHPEQDLSHDIPLSAPGHGRGTTSRHCRAALGEPTLNGPARLRQRPNWRRPAAQR